jgi:hypothetical protein
LANLTVLCGARIFRPRFAAPVQRAESDVAILLRPRLLRVSAAHRLIKPDGPEIRQKTREALPSRVVFAANLSSASTLHRAAQPSHLGPGAVDRGVPTRQVAIDRVPVLARQLALFDKALQVETTATGGAAIAQTDDNK